MKKSTSIILLLFLSVSIILNVVLGFVVFKEYKNSTSYEGTWKCSSGLSYEITMYVDHNGTFYQAFSIDDRPYNVAKGFIEGDTLVYKGSRMIEEGDKFEYLSDIPDDMYEEDNTFYKIERTSKNTLTLKTSDGEGTRLDFIRVDK